MPSVDKTSKDPVIGRFDRLFALCEQEMRTPIRRRISKQDEAKQRDETEAFRLAAIQSLLQRPIG